MKTKDFNTKDIRIGKLKNFSVEHNGVDLIEDYGMVFMIKNEKDGKYYNIFNLSDNYPVYERVPYSNVTADGQTFGTKIVYIQGDFCDGPCIILERDSLLKFIKSDEVSYEELEKYILETDFFFKDYEDIVALKDYNFIKHRKMIKKHENEINKLRKFLGEETYQLKK